MNRKNKSEYSLNTAKKKIGFIVKLYDNEEYVFAYLIIDNK